MGDEFNIKTAVHVFTQDVIDKNKIIIIIIIIFVRFEFFTMLILGFPKSVLKSKFCL